MCSRHLSVLPRCCSTMRLSRLVRSTSDSFLRSGGCCVRGGGCGTRSIPGLEAADALGALSNLANMSCIWPNVMCVELTMSIRSTTGPSFKYSNIESVGWNTSNSWLKTCVAAESGYDCTIFLIFVPAEPRRDTVGEHLAGSGA